MYKMLQCDITAFTCAGNTGYRTTHVAENLI